MKHRQSNKVALVAGGAGFIGSNLCDALVAEGATVIGLDNFQTGRPDNLRQLHDAPGFDFIEHDVIEALPARLSQGALGLTHIYNLACAASPPHYQADPEHTLMTSVVGTRNLLRLAERTGARLLLASTSEVYGDPEVHPQTEDYRGSVSCTGPRACYDEGKRAAETLAFDFARSGRADIRVARLFNTFGPRMRADDGRVVSNVICQALTGDDITIYGDGTQTRSFCFVADMLEGLARLMECDSAAGIPVNLGNPEEITVRALADSIVEMTGSAARVTYLPLPEDDPRRRKPNIDRARKLLGWEPRFTLDAGLRATIDWFESRTDGGTGPLRTERLAAAAE